LIYSAALSSLLNSSSNILAKYIAKKEPKAVHSFTMESCFKVVKKMAETIKLLDNHGAWWYSLFGDEDDDSSLCNVFKIDYSTLLKIYGHCGWLGTLIAGNQPMFNKLGFSTFKRNHNIELEYDSFNKTHYVCIGSFRKATGRFSCKNRIKLSFAKPRIGTAMSEAPT
jgi:hypothetical protein